PGGLDRLISTAKPGQQLAVKPGEMVAGWSARMWVLPVDCNPALHPNQRLIRLAARDQHSGDGMAVPRGDPGLSGEDDVGREVFLRKVDRAQKLAPMPEKILGFVAQRFTRRRLGRGCSLEAHHLE